ncbi:MAG TPA: hypothetical protein VHA52_01870 [Candidatus Babeliaceae bacterium]|nr:hypothetical protein [Candidatus Babeliaceae bacterium]
MAEKNRSHGHSGSMTPEEAGHLGGIAPRKHGMSREEAGEKGGSAPHRCRGFECQKGESHRSSGSKSGQEE